MYTLEKTRTEEISPRRAAEILSKENNFDGQRTLRKYHANDLSIAIKEGSLLKGQIAFGENGTGKRCLVNGQHTLQGIVLSERTLRCTIDEYHCEDAEDFWKLFAIFDVGKVRTETDVMKAARCLFTSQSLTAVSFRSLTCCATALAVLGDGVKPNFNFKKFPKTLKPMIVQEHEDEVVFVHNIFLDAGCNERLTVPLATPIIATSRRNKEQCKLFWTKVITGADLVKRSPEWELSRSLGSAASLSVRAAMSKSSSGRGKMVKIWNLSIAWWNSYITKTDRKIVNLSAIKGVLDIA